MLRECKINVHEDDELVMIEIVGDLTASAEKAMDSAYQKACGYNAKNILLKFDGKSRINSAGIATIINMVTESQEKECEIYITGVSKHFRKIFELVGLTKYTTIVESEEEVGKL
ncbi:STAS domain-containing protein [bacterium]|nr:STAS domain-containing protein [bacterium]